MRKDLNIASSKCLNCNRRCCRPVRDNPHDALANSKQGISTLRMLCSRRAQMELFGVVIVVLLVTIGIFFAIKYQPGQSTGAPSSTVVFEDQQLASNMIGAIMRTTSMCEAQRFHALFQDCGGLNGIYCPIDDYGCRGNSCEYLRCTMTRLLNDTLGVWGKVYDFSAYKVNDACQGNKYCFNVTSGDCTRYGKPAIQPLPLGTGGTVFVKLLVCSKGFA